MNMTLRSFAVAVRQLPETLSASQGRLFLMELEDYLAFDRPSIVLDCSKMRQMDRPAIHLLLRCLEEAMMRNGDVRLAAVPEGAKEILELIGVSRLFEMFDTDAGAVSSFHQSPLDAAR